MSNVFPKFPPPVPFNEHKAPIIPFDIFPGVVGDYAVGVATSIQAPFELAFINVLGAVAAVGQKKFRVQVHDSYSEPINIYALAILPPGERKSAVKDACRSPLLEWEVEQQNIFAEHLKYANAENLINEAAISSLLLSVKKSKTAEERKKLACQLKDLKNECSKLPVAPRLLADDTTPEALAALMSQHGQRIAMLEAEGGFFDTLAGRYSSGVPNLDVVLKAWSGEAIRIDRRHSDPILLDDPTLTLVLSAQPDVLAGVAQTRSFRGRGLLGRLLFILPQSLIGNRIIETHPIPEELKERYKSVLRRIIDIPGNKDSNGNYIPYMLGLHHEAKAAWLSFASKIETSLAEGASLEAMRDWGGKLPGQALRLAGIYHITLYEKPYEHFIDINTMESVLRLCQLLIDHAKAVFCLMGADEAIECAKAILKWIIEEQLEQFTARACLEKIKGRWPKMSFVNPGLSVLEERSFIIPQSQDHQRRGRPSKIYIVNSLVLGG